MYMVTASLYQKYNLYGRAKRVRMPVVPRRRDGVGKLRNNKNADANLGFASLIAKFRRKAWDLSVPACIKEKNDACPSIFEKNVDGYCVV